MIVILFTGFFLPSGRVRAEEPVAGDGVGASPKPFVVMDSEAGIDSVVDNINYEIRRKLPEGSVATNWKFLE